MRVVLLMSFVLLSCVSAVQTQSPQNGSSKVSGRVYDRNGSVIPEATIKFLNKKRKAVEVKSDQEGIYRAELQPGFYTIEFTMSGFYKLDLPCYQIPSNTALTLDVTLTVGGEGKCDACSTDTEKSKDDKRVII